MAIEANPDWMLRVANTRLHNAEKYIRTTGMPDVDTLISIYNDQDIVAREGFEKGMVYTYELGLPLKYLHLSADKVPKFSYHIVLAGLNVDKDLDGAGAGPPWFNRLTMTTRFSPLCQ